MTVHQDSDFNIYFGDRSDQLFMSHATYHNLSKKTSLLDIEPFSRVGTTLNISNLIFARQVHGSQIREINTQTLATTKSFSFEGDALVTQEQNIGIGVLTADCLPIIMHDKVNHAIAIIHAGWRSSVEHIAPKTVAFMNVLYGTKPADIQIYFGPCAGPCCYTVGDNLRATLGNYHSQTIAHRGGNMYFDNRLYNQLLLQESGVPDHAFCFDYNVCTICNSQFWSYRREKEQAGRQITAVHLK